MFLVIAIPIIYSTSNRDATQTNALILLGVLFIVIVYRNSILYKYKATIIIQSCTRSVIIFRCNPDDDTMLFD